MAKRPKREIPADAIAIYEKLVAKIPGQKVKGAAAAYTSLNGNMFSFMTKEGRLALRMAKADREAFLAKHPDSVCVQYNTVMKDYVLVPDEKFRNPRIASRMFRECYAHAETLKPKPTTKKKTAKKKTAKAAKKKTKKKAAKKATKKKPAAKKTAKKKAAKKKTAKKKAAKKKATRKGRTA